jgi:archaellum biogenesis ATPase FlaH
MNEHGVPLEFNGTKPGVIRRFRDIPDVLSMEIPPVEYIVPALGISRGSITLWTGMDGDGKSFLAEAMTVAVASGGEFLGMKCQQSPVLYLDLENAAHTVQARLRAITEEETISDLRVWGIWNEQQPPQAGSELLLTMAKETRPLIIVDPFRYFHNAEENDSTAMAGVMQYLRACAAYGCAVILLHHPAKSEGSTGRGSSAIRGACDLAFLHSLDKESGLITLKVDKNRNGESRKITIRADFEDGRFEVADSPYLTRRTDDMVRIEEIIKSQPGISQNGIVKASGFPRKRVPGLLDEGRGTRWYSQPGPRKAKLYYAGQALTGSLVPTGASASDTSHNARESTFSDLTGFVQGVGGALVPLVRRPIDDTSEPVADPGAKTLPSCTKCGSYALYRDGSCMTCADSKGMN